MPLTPPPHSVFVDRGPSCKLGTGKDPNYDHDYRSSLLSTVGDTLVIWVTAHTEPPLQRGYWSISIIGENMIPGELAAFDVAITNPLWQTENSGAASARLASLWFAVALTLAATLAAALGTAA